MEIYLTLDKKDIKTAIIGKHIIISPPLVGEKLSISLSFSPEAAKEVIAVFTEYLKKSPALNSSKLIE